MDAVGFSKNLAAGSAFEDAIVEAFQNFRPHDTAVSLRHILDTVRRKHPECDLPDDFLNRHVGDIAIRRGYNIHFDGNSVEIGAADLVVLVGEDHRLNNLMSSAPTER